MAFPEDFFGGGGHPQPINTMAHGTRIAKDQASLMLPQPGPPRNLDNIMITFMKISITLIRQQQTLIIITKKISS